MNHPNILLQKCFTYAVDQNRADSACLWKGLETNIPNTFYDHKACADNNVCWLEYISVPDGYKCKSLTHNEGLSDAGLPVDR